MAQPGDYRRLGPLLDGDAFRSGDGAATHGRRMCCYGEGQAVGEIGVILMKGQEPHDRSVEILNIFRLDLLTAATIGCLLLGESLS